MSVLWLMNAVLLPASPGRAAFLKQSFCLFVTCQIHQLIIHFSRSTNPVHGAALCCVTLQNELIALPL